jgi:hypothetical protein
MGLHTGGCCYSFACTDPVENTVSDIFLACLMPQERVYGAATTQRIV